MELVAGQAELHIPLIQQITIIPILCHKIHRSLPLTLMISLTQVPLDAVRAFVAFAPLGQSGLRHAGVSARYVQLLELGAEVFDFEALVAVFFGELVDVCQLNFNLFLIFVVLELDVGNLQFGLEEV